MTEMTSGEIRDTVVRCFEASRERPGAPYEPDRFLAYLTAQIPASGRRAGDRLAARRRLCRLVDGVQLDLGVCFTNDEWERGHSLSEFVELVEKKRRNPAATRRLALKRLHDARVELIDGTIKQSLLAAILLGLPMLVPSIAVRIGVGALWIGAVVAAFSMNVGTYRYWKQLVARLGEDADQRAAPTG